MPKTLTIEQETLKILAEARAKSDSCLVSFSGGRDSLVVLDLCLRAFKRVECFFMQVVPGLESVERWAIEGAARYGVPLHMVSHWIAFRFFKYGIYCFAPYEHATLPDVKIHDVYAEIIDRTGIPIVATGAKRSDSVWRKRYLDSTKGWTEVVNPIVGWSKHEVAAYLAQRKIPHPQGGRDLDEMVGEKAKNAGGLDLSTKAVCRLHDLFPEDYAVLHEHFPFVGAVVKRRGMMTGSQAATGLDGELAAFAAEAARS